MVEGAFLGLAAFSQSALGPSRPGENDHFLVALVLDCLDELRDRDLRRTCNLVEPPREEDGDEDYRHPVDDQGSKGAVHRTSFSEGVLVDATTEMRVGEPRLFQVSSPMTPT